MACVVAKLHNKFQSGTAPTFFFFTFCFLFFTFCFLLGLLNARDSLFAYHEGEKHEDFVDTAYVPMFFDNLESLFSDKILEVHAKATCGDVKECLFDIAASGSLSFGNSTKQSVAHYNERKKDINTGKALKQTVSAIFLRLLLLSYSSEGGRASFWRGCVS